MRRSLRNHLAAGLIAGPMLTPVAASPVEDAVTTPPALRSTTEPTADCYPIGAIVRQREGSVSVVLSVAADGRVIDMRLPAGTPSWMTAATRCVVDRLEFAPATLDGVAVESPATLPLDFMLKRGSGVEAPSMSRPQRRSDDSQLETAYRDCYPTGLGLEQTVGYQFAVGVDGRVRGITVVESSGDDRLDQAGNCVLKKLRFTPALRGNQAVKSLTTSNLLVRPPR